MESNDEHTVDIETTMIDSDLNVPKRKYLRQRDHLVNIRNTREWIRKEFPGMKVSSAAYPYLTKKIQDIVSRAARRSKANRRTVIMLRDL